VAGEAVRSGAALKFLDERCFAEASLAAHVDDAASMGFYACCHCGRKLTEFACPSHECTVENWCVTRSEQPPGPHRRDESLHIDIAHILAVQPILHSTINGR
jgi:hypothetical protein